MGVENRFNRHGEPLSEGGSQSQAKNIENNPMQ